MTPGNAKIVIKRGGRYVERLVFTNKDDGTPIDLTGMGPWICQVRSRPTSTLLIEITVHETDPTNGILDLEALPAVTDVKPQEARWGIMDHTGVVFVEGIAEISGKVPASNTVV